MTKYIVPAISFIAGSCFGVLAMCCLSANRLNEDGWDEDDEEDGWDEDDDDWDEDDDDWDEGVMGLAGGSGEQDREPCGHDDEAGGADGDRGGAHVSPAPGKGKGAESL